MAMNSEGEKGRWGERERQKSSSSSPLLPFSPSPLLLLSRRLQRRHRFFVIGMRADFRHIFDVGELVVLVHNEDRPREQREAQAFKEHAIVLAERVIAHIGQI